MVDADSSTTELSLSGSSGCCTTLLVIVLTRGLAALSVLLVALGGTGLGVQSLVTFTLFAVTFIGRAVLLRPCCLF